MMFASCSNDEPEVPVNGGADSDVYATLTLRLPSASTGRAGSNGIEIGQPTENTVGKLLVVLATKNENGQYCFLTSAETDARPNGSDATLNTIKYTLNFSAKDLNPNPLDKDENSGGASIPGTTVYTFVYCNPSAMLLDRFNVSKGVVIDNIYASLDDKDNSSMWTANKFLMTNSEISAPKQIPSREDLVNKHNAPEKAFNLGVVKVKRCAARFDFQIVNDNKYDIKDIEDPTKKVGTIELTKMAMFNIQKSFYYLPHVSETWAWTVPVQSGVLNYGLCEDTEAGYVMSYNEGNFKNKLLGTTYRNQFYSNIIDANLKSDKEGGLTHDLCWTSIKPEDWNKRGEDDNEGWTPSEETDYRIWRYTTENTIPQLSNGQGTASQRQGITTGVVFKGEFTPVNTEVWNGNVVYVHNNLVYGDFKALCAYIAKYPESVVANDFKNVDKFKNVDPETADLKANLLDGVDGVNRHGFKAYVADENGKYSMYYFYFNRHNTNGNNSLMGTNEFGVVRNNVYKLRVTKIESLGDPKAPNNPEDPNEEENAYFTVSCEVLPWTVRINNIDF